MNLSTSHIFLKFTSINPIFQSNQNQIKSKPNSLNLIPTKIPSAIPPNSSKNPIKTLTKTKPIKQSTMSRSLSQTLTRISTARSTVAVAARRSHSNLPEIGVAKTKEEIERAALKKLEDAIHRLIIKKSQPDWLPFVPGGSYWVPPKSESRGFAKAVTSLVRDSTSVVEFMRNDVSFGLNGNRGWPTSAVQFFTGATNSPLDDVNLYKDDEEDEEMNFEDANLSEDEE